MEIFAISDIHSRIDRITEAKKAIKKADYVVIAGDITHFGDIDEAGELIEELKKLNPRIIAVPGNCDHMDITHQLGDFCTEIHGKSFQDGEIGFFGVGGSNKTPFSTPQEYPDEDLGEFVAAGYNQLSSKTKIMLTHVPPYNIKLDLTGGGVHTGSKKIRKFIEDNQVDLVISGHIHEAIGVDYIGDTMIINPGPFHMGYAWIRMSDKIDVEFVRF